MLLRHNNLLITGVVGLLVALAGCGGAKRGQVSGQVTLDGAPVDGGEIRFLPNVGLPARADIVNGRYTIPEASGPSLGMVRVEVRWTRKTGRRVPAMAPAPPGTMIEETAQSVPARFNRNSELQVDIASGNNQFDFALDTAGGAGADRRK
jgi:hypothetical protein